MQVATPPGVEPTLEVGLVLPPSASDANQRSVDVDVDGSGSTYPGLYLMMSAARFIRPVLQSASGRVELIGAFELVEQNSCFVRSLPSHLPGMDPPFCHCDALHVVSLGAPGHHCDKCGRTTVGSTTVHSQRTRRDQHALAACIADAILRLQSVTPQHVSVSDGQADDGNTRPLTTSSHRQQNVCAVARILVLFFHSPSGMFTTAGRVAGITF